MDRETRRLQHSKRSSLSIQKYPPAKGSMIDGQEVLVQSGGNNLRLYRKELGVLWYIEFDRYGEDDDLIWDRC